MPMQSYHYERPSTPRHTVDRQAVRRLGALTNALELPDHLFYALTDWAALHSGDDVAVEAAAAAERKTEGGAAALGVAGLYALGGARFRETVLAALSGDDGAAWEDGAAPAVALPAMLAPAAAAWRRLSEGRTWVAVLPASEEDGPALLDLVLFDEEKQALVLVALQSDADSLPATAAALGHAIARIVEAAPALPGGDDSRSSNGEQPLQQPQLYYGEVWTDAENSCGLSDSQSQWPTAVPLPRLSDARLLRLVVASARGRVPAAAAAAAGSERPVATAAGVAGLQVPERLSRWVAGLADALAPPEESAADVKANSAAAVCGVQHRLLPWAVALARQRLREEQGQQEPEEPCCEPHPTGAAAHALRFAPVRLRRYLPTATPLPPKDAPLFGLVLFPPTVRRAFDVPLPQVMLNCNNNKGAPLFEYDDEALAMVARAVRGLHAAVCVYDEGQRRELLRLLHAWGRGQGAAAATVDALAPHIFTITAGLRFLHAFEDSTTTNGQTPSAPHSPTSAAERDGGDGSGAAAAAQDGLGAASAAEEADVTPVRPSAFLEASARHGVLLYNPSTVLFRRDARSFRPVPPLTPLQTDLAPPPPQEDLEGAGEERASGDKAGADHPICYTVSPFPDCFLSSVLQQMAEFGPEYVEVLAMEVLDSMKRLVNRQ